MKMHSAARLQNGFRIIAAACVLAVASCGGGGYGGGGSGTMPPPPPTVTLTVQPATVVLGQSATLNWSAPAGADCTASGGWTGTQAVTGSATVTPTATGTVTYTLSCTVSGGGYAGGSSTGKASAPLAVTAASGFTATTLVSDTNAGGGLVTDASLVNPWGIAFGPGFSWVANNHTGTSTLYDGNGKAQPAAAPLVVSFATGAGGASFDPTGVVYNAGTGFVVSAGAVSATAKFVFAGEGGMIAGWSQSVDATHAITMYADAGGAVYKGLAIASNGSGEFLYATDFHNGKVDVFNSSFALQAASAFPFTDATLPAGYAPFGIQALKTGTGGAVQVYVSYAKQALPDKHDETDGAGLGLVDVYDANGKFVSHLVATGGKLNAPWGMALAPADFGTLSASLLVGNFGDGTINAFDPATGSTIGSVKSATGTNFAAPGLWGIAFGNDADNQPHNTLFYAAGPNAEANGAYGRIDLGGAPVLNAPPLVAITAPIGSVSGSVAVTATATASIGIAKVQFFADGVSIGSATTSPFSVSWDTTAVPSGTAVKLTATATDVDGNVGSAAAVYAVAGTVKLSQLQASIFTPKCTACHDGSGTALPGVQNLSAGNTYANIVNVASIEVPSLKRAAPGNSANSYIVQKLEGAASISGVRMPKGGPYLDEATIALVKAWIDAGAANN
jgi:uncharacterized protein (TIGR03118 family)